MTNKPVKTILILYGSGLILIGIFGFFLGAFLGLFRIFFNAPGLKIFIQDLIWYSAMPVVIGILIGLLHFILLVNKKRINRSLENNQNLGDQVTAVLTAYNDEKSIGDAVIDFKNNKFVKRVVVVSNNSTDRTMEVAQEAGAIVVNELNQGYGACVYRALREGLNYSDTQLICISEGDRTFRASDLEKFMAYSKHAEIINGTRIVEKLQDGKTQLTMFMHYGNFAVAKLLELKYAGETTLSDVGSTYRLIRRSSLERLIHNLNPKINHEFNPHLLEEAIKAKISMVECPITFHPRVGLSKGANQSNKMSIRIGIRMILGIFFGWGVLHE